MTLTVLNVAYSLATVGDDAVGGAEQVLTAIDAALVDAGATSLVVACEGSRPRGRLCATPARRGPLHEATCAAARAAHARAIQETLDRYPVDVVHLHGVDYLAYVPPPGVPALATLHLPTSWYPAAALAPDRADTFVHCVSEAQRRTCPSSRAMLSTITNGVAIPTRRAERTRTNEVVAMGRICPEKGFHLALDAARRAGVPMTLAGQVFAFPDHVRYFESEILPRLDAERRFAGPLGAEPKQALLARARCVLVPSLVAETSSLVAMEALAAGTPVVAFANGALTEIIEHGVTGFLVRDVGEMAEAIVAAAELDPEACRVAAEQRFSVEAMTRRYLRRYSALARGDPASEARDSVSAAAIPLTPGRAADIVLTEVGTEWALRALALEWRRLCDRAPCTPFQRPEWLLPWWRHFGAGTMRVVTARRGRELVGLAPLYSRPGALGRPALSFIGVGNSDYLDLAATADARDAVTTAVVALIARQRKEWGDCELGPLPSGSALLTHAVPRGWHASITRWGTCPVLPLPRTPGRVDGAVPARLLAQLRYERRRLEREHVVEIEEACADSAGRLFEELCRLHAARWQIRGAIGVLADERACRFHREVVQGFADAGLLRLYLLRADGHAVAAFYGFEEKGTLYYYLGGFDPDLRKHSVGSLAILHAIEQAAARGCTAFDFLQGAEPYKYRWGATDRPVYGWRIESVAATAAGGAP